LSSESTHVENTDTALKELGDVEPGGLLVVEIHVERLVDAPVAALPLADLLVVDAEEAAHLGVVEVVAHLDSGGVAEAVGVLLRRARLRDIVRVDAGPGVRGTESHLAVTRGNGALGGVLALDAELVGQLVALGDGLGERNAGVDREDAVVEVGVALAQLRESV